MPTADYRLVAKQAIAREMRVPLERLAEDATIGELGLDSLAFAEAIIAVEAAIDRPIDAAVLTRRVTENTSLRELLDAVIVAIEPTPRGA